MTEFPVDQRRSWVIALMIECPLGKALLSCPATGVRGRPLAEVVKIVGELSEDELNRIIRHHRQCLDARESASHVGLDEQATGG